ncbi:unnamed protein product [Dovyalis caffra]|uniref:Uncharacterized protein n=1 Tax=Dovyalis caffra TaxID=77055 RepID=A0AAV1RL93_9ROSI|nr:unnamed protein product [Dovyalis caffra]
MGLAQSSKVVKPSQGSSFGPDRDTQRGQGLKEKVGPPVFKKKRHISARPLDRLARQRPNRIPKMLGRTNIGTIYLKKRCISHADVTQRN